MTDYSVEIQDVVKHHGATLALDRLSLEVHRGEFFSILGPSGSGKSSTLRLLAGFDQPDRGDIRIEGRSMRGVPPNLRPVNLVFQSYALFPHLTVFGNVAFGLEMRRLPRAEIETRVTEALDMVKLGDKRTRFPAHLAGGEQQRVALARALVNRPAVLLLDEPLGALDQQLRQDMQVELKAIQERVGLTFMSVTHHQEEALTMSDRVAVMDRGRLLQVGTPQEIYESPACSFVATFIGVSNSLAGRILSASDGRWTIQAELPGAPAILARRAIQGEVGDRVMVLLRPECLHLSREIHLNGFENSLRTRVTKALYNGGEVQYLLRLSDNVSWKVRLSNRDGAPTRFLPGEAVLVRWKAEDGVVLTQ